MPSRSEASFAAHFQPRWQTNRKLTLQNATQIALNAAAAAAAAIGTAAYVMMACPVLESHHDIAALNSNSLLKK